jgi:NADH:ubiquinone oxidoreductase subunit 5 (subunit L)/multisubunit Na+/H+ antiporter MnhA subunit
LALLHVLSHVLYKGSLFMQAGIIDHVAGTRDLRKLSGLRKALPLTFVAALLTTASLAGLPGSLGFVSKELYLEAALKLIAEGHPQGWAILAVLITGAICFATVAWRLATQPWLGALPKTLQNHLHHAARGFQLPPLLLALAVPVLGFAPAFAWHALAPLGGASVDALHVSAFHGVNTAFLITVACLAAGIVLSRALYNGKLSFGLPKALDWGPALDQGLLHLGKFAKRLSTWIRVDKPTDYLSVVIGACALFMGSALWLLLPQWPQAAVVNPTLLEGLVLALMAGSGLGVVFLEQWATRLLSLGIVGFLVCFYFMLNKAPDLALTQMLIESATLVLLLLLLGRFPQGAQADEAKDRGRSLRKIVAAVISVAVGLIVFLYMLHITALPHPRPMGKDFLVQTLPLAYGSNAVNTVLVDFRGFDTMFEITVLCIAALGCLGLLMRWKEKDGGRS